ncbi:MAG: dTMP kinase [Thermoplasmata archaeon]
MTRPHRAPLVAIEGIDGSGKTTLQRALAEQWRGRGLRVLELQEPSRGPTGQKARRISGQDPWTAAVAFTDDRRHQRGRIERALERGTVVLQDRSFYSTLAYQGTALPPGRRRELARIQLGATVVPDRVILLVLPVSLSESRIHRRGPDREPMEQREVLRRASRAYRRFARRPGWVVLDARQAPEQLLARLDRRLTPWVLRRARERA